MLNSLLRILAAAMVFACTSSAGLADSITFVTWNTNGGQQSPAELAHHARSMQSDLGDFDVLILQEVISEEQVSEIAEALEFPYWAISDFSPPIEVTNQWFASLEVAILSRVQITNAVEWDTSGNLPTGDVFDPKPSSPTIQTATLDLGLVFPRDTTPSRGFLRADIIGDVSIYAAHWKSSRGEADDSDLTNAAKRENAATGIAQDAITRINAGATVVIAGDLNIQPYGKNARVGRLLEEDCRPSLGNCGINGLDGYDDSLAILSTISDSYRLLTSNLAPTYIGRDFGPGAIDHIAVAGPRASMFGLATSVSASGSRYHGSDHLPVIGGI